MTQNKIPANWTDLRVALAVKQTGGIKKAAKQLTTTEATVSRHVAALEEALDTVLFERTAKGMAPTPACVVLMKHVEKAESEFETGIEAAIHTHQQPAGTVRITTVPILMNHVLIPQSIAFAARNPEIHLELLADDTDLSMQQREADIAVRLSRPVTEMNIITSCIGALEYGVYALTERLHAVHHATLPWIAYEPRMSRLPQAHWIANQIKQQDGHLSNIACNDAECLLSAIQSGMGKTLLPRIVGQHFPSLTELHEYERPPTREVWVLIHPNLQMTGRIRVTLDWLKTLFNSG